MNTEQENTVPPSEESDKPFSQDDIKSIDIVCTDPRKAAMLKALVSSLGIVTYATQEAGLSRQAHYNWLKNDSEYRAAAETVNEVVLDMAEAKLFKLIKESDFRAVMFVLRTRGRGRGYSMFKEEMAKQKSVFNFIIQSEKDTESIKKNAETE